MEINKTTLKDVYKEIKSQGVTFNIIDNGKCVMSKTVMFGWGEDDINDKFIVIKSGGMIELFIGKNTIDRYVLTRIESNGVLWVFTYRVGE